MDITVLSESEGEEEKSTLNVIRDEEERQTLIKESNNLMEKDTEYKQLSQVEETGEKTEWIENLEWEQVIRKLKGPFSKNPVKLIVCLGIIRYPPLEERDPIMQKAHSSVVGGHRGVTKTYKRVTQDYN